MYIKIIKSKFILQIIQNKKILKEFFVSIGKIKGRKIQRNDNKTPIGIYYIIDKQKLLEKQFKDYGKYWLKINYPNKSDIIYACKRKIITENQKNKYLKKIEKDKFYYLRGTELGDGIGLHGFEEDKNIGKMITKGCIRMRNKDLEFLYNLVEIGTRVIIKEREYKK